MNPHFQRDRKLDRSALGGTVASVVAFALMGWVISSLMWRPIEPTDLESVGPEIENSDSSGAESDGSAKPSNSKPRKIQSKRTLTA